MILAPHPPAVPTTTIRVATDADVPAIVAMGLRFASTTYHDCLPANAECLTALAETILVNEAATIFVADQAGALTGMLAAQTYVQPMSGETLGTEICWWMEPEARGSRAAMRLLKAAEAWAKARGAVRFYMIAPTDQVAAFYERLGFTRVEIHYQRPL